MHGEGYEEHILYKGYGRIDLRTVVGHILVDRRMLHSCFDECFGEHTYSIEVVVDDGHVVDIGVEYFELALEGSSLIHQSSSLRDPFVVLVEYVEYVEYAKLDEND